MESSRSRQLQDSESGKIWSSECTDSRVIIRAGKSGSERESEKILADKSAALAYAEKEEWARLKKGFVLNTPTAEPGQPRMHRYLGRGYTGAMVVEGLGDGQLMFNQYDETLESDTLVFLNEDARLNGVVPLPEKNTLLWIARYCPNQQSLLLLVDHQIFSYSLRTQEFKKLTDRNKSPASFLSLRGDLAAWYEEPEIVVHDLSAGQPILRMNVTAEKYKLHSLQMKADLSPNGTTLACCSSSGEIILFDVGSGQQAGSLKGNFQMVKRLSFSPDGNYLLIQEEYGTWGLHCFDVQQMKERTDWPKLSDMANGDFAFHASGLMAVSRNKWIEIFDLATMGSALKFRADHIVKSCAIRFVDRYLAVRTDYGCASLYSVA